MRGEREREERERGGRERGGERERRGGEEGGERKGERRGGKRGERKRERKREREREWGEEGGGERLKEAETDRQTERADTNSLRLLPTTGCWSRDSLQTCDGGNGGGQPPLIADQESGPISDREIGQHAPFDVWPSRQ